MLTYDCLFACLFVLSFSSHSKIFHPWGDITITGERLQILNNARHSLALDSDDSLECHTYYDKGHLFIMAIFEVL